MTEPVLRHGLERYYPPRGDLCLCLSGGGFRASAFHLGAVGWLYRAGLLEYVQEVRSVSGGSILAAWMFTNSSLLFEPLSTAGLASFELDFARPLRKFLCRDIRTVPFIRSLGVNIFRKAWRCSLLAREIDQLLVQRPGGVGQSRLPRFRLIAFDVDRECMVELEPDRDRLALQVVASAAFPPLIGPLHLDGRRLVDGGVASNLGVSGSTLNEWRCVLISDASRAFPSWLRGRALPISARIFGLVRDGANRAFRVQLGEANSDNVIVSVAPLSVEDWYGGAPDLPRLQPVRRLSRLRTDLAGFAPGRIRELEEVGAKVAEATFGRAVSTWSVRIASGDSMVMVEQEGLSRVLSEWGELELAGD